VAPFAATRVTESIKPANDAQAAYKEKALNVPASYVARLVSFLVSDAARTTGQLFGVRGREVLLFSQPRPKETVVHPRDSFDPSLMQRFEPHLADLITDLEAFSGDPIL